MKQEYVSVIVILVLVSIVAFSFGHIMGGTRGTLESNCVDAPLDDDGEVRPGDLLEAERICSAQEGVQYISYLHGLTIFCRSGYFVKNYSYENKVL